MKNEFTDIKTLVQSSMTLQARFNKLIKLKNETEDLELHKMIIGLANHYSVGKCFINTEEITRRNNEIIAYCDKMIATQKPEWQIQAERHGWVPGK